MTDHPGPSPAVLAAFGARDARGEPIAGGEETSVLAGGIVFKQVQDVIVSEWGQVLLANLRPAGVSTTEPIAASDGRWSVDGWIATRFISRLRSLKHDPARVIDAGNRLADAIADRPPACVDPVRQRADRWARADRCVWGEEAVPLKPEANSVAGVLRAKLRSPDRERATIVHGDLTGNVFADPSDRPVVLDFTPVLRPRRFAAAIVVGDNLLWNDGDVGLRTLLDNDDDALARALLFRLIAEQLADRPRHHRNLDDYRRVIGLLDWAAS
ncbi:MAG: hypothetical protein ACR2QO_28655 [Acidimicrobiales bacterium]